MRQDQDFVAKMTFLIIKWASMERLMEANSYANVTICQLSRFVTLSKQLTS